MIQTLGCLAGAMTGTASLLAWIDPSSTPPPQTLTGDALVALARSLVFDDVPLRRAQWKQVEIVKGPALQSAGVLLTAGADRSECHFHIDREGRPSRASRWDRQLAPSNAPHTIRIEIAVDDTQPFPSPTQQDGVQVLLDTLNDAVAQRYSE